MHGVRGSDLLREAASASRRSSPSPLRRRLREEAMGLLRREGLIKAAFSYRIVPLDAPAAETLQAGGESLHAPRLLPESGELTALGCAVYTLGSALEARVSQLFAAKRPSLELALDALGNELLFALGRRAQDRMAADAVRRGLTLGVELHAGDPGLAIQSQAAVLRLAQAEALGVGLGRGQAMHPLKSASMVFGVGTGLSPSRRPRCAECPSRGRCRLAARAAGAMVTEPAP